MKKIFTICAALMAAMTMSAEETTISCADAAAQALALGDNETATETVNVIGYITKTNGTVSREQQTFYMDDEKGSGKETLQAYWANLPEDDKKTPLAVGDKVILTGNLLHYVNKDGTSHVAEIKNGNVTIIDRTITKIDTIAVDVCEAIEEGLALNSGEYTNDIFEVSGVITKVTYTKELSAGSYSQTFYMACEGMEADLQGYNCTVSGDSLVAGDNVKVLGKLTNYNGQVEIASGKAWLADNNGDDPKPVDKDIVYTLVATQGDNSSYDGSCDIKVGDYTWTVEGNCTLEGTYAIGGWGLGGGKKEGLAEQDRAIYSHEALPFNISKVEVTHKKVVAGLTINSFKLVVSDASNQAGEEIEVDAKSIVENAVVTFERPEGSDWTNKHYKFVYNLTAESGKNVRVEFSKADFYGVAISEGFENTIVAAKAVKVIRNGQMIIVRDGMEYNVLGTVVK